MTDTHPTPAPLTATQIAIAAHRRTLELVHEHVKVLVAAGEPVPSNAELQSIVESIARTALAEVPEFRRAVLAEVYERATA